MPHPKITTFPRNINTLHPRSFAYGVPVSHPFSERDPVNEPEPDYKLSDLLERIVSHVESSGYSESAEQTKGSYYSHEAISNNGIG